MRARGFTLIEVMVVVAIAGIVAAYAMFQYSGFIEDSERAMVATNYQHAVDYVRSRYLNAEQHMHLGLIPDTRSPTTRPDGLPSSTRTARWHRAAATRSKPAVAIPRSAPSGFRPAVSSRRATPR